MKQRENEKVRTDREEAPSVEELSQRERTMLEMIWRQFIQHRPAVISSVVILLLITACALAFLSPYDPYDMDLPHKFEPPSPAHPMGRDPVGRDLLTRILYGGRMSLIIGIAAMVVGQVIGVTVGSLAGYFGGALDNVLMRFTDAVLSFPSLFILILVGAMLRETDFAKWGGGVPSIVVIIGTLSWMSIARLVRAAFLSLREQDFVIAARSYGAGNLRIMLLHILPNAMGPIIVAGTLQVGYAILTESGLSFLGFGVMPPTPTWGNMLSGAQTYMFRSPWVGIFPGLMILITTVCINYIGDGLRDALDPYQVVSVEFKA